MEEVDSWLFSASMVGDVHKVQAVLAEHPMVDLKKQNPDAVRTRVRPEIGSNSSA